MERNRRWVIAPRRAIISAVLSIAAVFVIFAAWGMHNWTIFAVGLAVLAGAVALAVISGMTSKIRGVAHLLEVNAPPAARYRGRVTATAIVRYKARRDSVRVVLREDDVPLSKWPTVHDELPVVGLSNDPWSAEVLWGQVPTHKRVAAKRRRAEARAAGAAAAGAADPTTAAAAGDGGGSTGSGGDMGGRGTATATAERADDDTVGYLDEPEFADDPDDANVATESVSADPAKGDNWSPPGSGKVVDGVWWESAVQPDEARLEADITTPDEPIGPRRRPGSKPSPRPRTAPEDVIVSVDFSSSDATEVHATEPITGASAAAQAAAAAEPPATAEPPAVTEPDGFAGPSAFAAPDPLTDPLPDPLTDPLLDSPAARFIDPLSDPLVDPLPQPLADPPIAEHPVPEPRRPDEDAADTDAEAFVPRQPTGPRHAAGGSEDDGEHYDTDSVIGDDPDDFARADEVAGDATAVDAITVDAITVDATTGDAAVGADDEPEPEDGMFGQPGSSLRTSPLQVKRAGVLPATVPAPRSDDEPYDHSYDEEAVAEAYRGALPPPGVDRSGHADVTVQLFVSNLSRAIIFYRDILGFTEIDAGRASAVLDLRDVRVILKVVDDMLPSTKNVQFSLEVDDLETAYEDLRARGVRFVHRPRRVEHYEQLEHYAAPFEDPDGHRISLSSWRSIYPAD